MNLSIIITTVNDTEELKQTVKSIHDTVPEPVEVIVVDDVSLIPVAQDDVSHCKLVTNFMQCGCGPSRHIGALNSSGSWLVFTDSHMRFQPGWYEQATEWLYQGDWNRTVFCGTCLSFDSTHSQPTNGNNPYQGATLNVCGPDRNDRTKTQVLEGVWLSRKEIPEEDGGEIPCAMGAIYFVHRDWYFQIDPLRHLRTWGGDEVMLSLKSWLAGGDVRILKNVRVAHKFWLKGDRQLFGRKVGHTLYNKLFIIHTLFPQYSWEAFQRKLNAHYWGPDLNRAKELLKDDWHLVAVEQAYNAGIFTRSIDWYLKRFGMKLPE